MSAHSNALGFYTVTADGLISSVHIAYANTLGTAAGTSIALGTPAAGEQIGFFLIQDGFDQFGRLPDNLAFVTQGSGAPADIDAGLPVLLQSATLGVLANATVFHSFARLNPGEANQVLSGITPGGDALVIGFEDLPAATADNDFQDVVVGIRAADTGTFIL